MNKLSSQNRRDLVRWRNSLLAISDLSKFNMLRWDRCALGHARAIPQFRRRWLGQAVLSIAAGERFFGITYSASCWLLSFAHYDVDYGEEVTPEMVAKRIDYLLLSDGRSPSEPNTP